jgi:hypothetical protein
MAGLNKRCVNSAGWDFNTDPPTPLSVIIGPTFLISVLSYFFYCLSYGTKAASEHLKHFQELGTKRVAQHTTGAIKKLAVICTYTRVQYTLERTLAFGIIIIWSFCFFSLSDFYCFGLDTPTFLYVLIPRFVLMVSCREQHGVRVGMIAQGLVLCDRY